MSRKMLVIGMVCLLTLLSLAIATPTQAQDVNFYLNAFDNDSLPNWYPVPGLWFTIRCYTEENLVVFQDEMYNPGGGALYWCYVDAEWLDGEEAVTWSVEFNGPGGWILMVPGNPFQDQGDINWGGDNVADPENWWVERGPGR